MNNYNISKGFLEKTFSKNLNSKLSKWLSNITLWLLQSDSCSLVDIATSMSSVNWKSYNTNLKQVERFTRNKLVQIDDSMRRTYIWIVLQWLKELDFLEDDMHISINVDFTSSTDKFLILSASISFWTRNIPLYFSMRNYPKKKWSMDQKKMERAFLKELHHLLPRAYKYTIKADRWFWNVRFINDCVDAWFDYIIRTNTNRNIEYLWNQTNIKDLSKEDKDMFIKLRSSWKSLRLVTSWWNTKNKWYIFTNLWDKYFESKDIILQYWWRFKIEKMFQDEKSSGFKIEDSKIKYYDRFKRLLFLVYLAQTITIFVWIFASQDSDIKKKYPLYLNLIWVFSKNLGGFLENSLKMH